MKHKGWMAVALAVAVAGSGTGILAGAMVGKQDAELTTFSSVSGEAAMVNESSELQKKGEDREEPGYKIEMAKRTPKDKNFVEKTEADMPAKKAVGFAVRRIRETFGPITVKKVTEVELIGNDDTSGNGKGREMDFRTYHGLVLCGGDADYVFHVNSITGQVIGIEKVMDYVDPGFDDTDAHQKYNNKFEKNREKYEKTAREYISRNMESGDVCECKLSTGSSMGGEYYGRFNWKRMTVEAECKTEDGTEYRITMDLHTYEILEWNLLFSE